MTLENILTLFQYDEWATKRTVESVSSLSEEQYSKDLNSSHRGIRGTLVHIYQSDCLWLERWRGSSLFLPVSEDQVSNLTALNHRWQECRESLYAYLVNLAESKLVAPFPYNDKQGNKHSEPLYQQMQHRVNHSSYHRGQIVTMLRQLGQKPLATDLIIYYGLKQEATT